MWRLISSAWPINVNFESILRIFQERFRWYAVGTDGQTAPLPRNTTGIVGTRDLVDVRGHCARNGQEDLVDDMLLQDRADVADRAQH